MLTLPRDVCRVEIHKEEMMSVVTHVLSLMCTQNTQTRLTAVSSVLEDKNRPKVEPNTTDSATCCWVY